MVAYLREGGYIDEQVTRRVKLTMRKMREWLLTLLNLIHIDEQTEAVSVEFVTFNNNGNYFAHVVFDFEWDAGGSIEWDYTMRTVPGPPVYRSTSRSPAWLQVISRVKLCVCVRARVCVCVRACVRVPACR